MPNLEVLMHRTLEKFLEDKPQPSVVRDLEQMFPKIYRMQRKDIVPTAHMLNALRVTYASSDRVQGLTYHLLLCLADRAQFLIDKHYHDEDKVNAIYERQYITMFQEIAL